MRAARKLKKRCELPETHRSERCAAPQNIYYLLFLIYSFESAGADSLYASGGKV